MKPPSPQQAEELGRALARELGFSYTFRNEKGTHKLTEEQVFEICSRYQQGESSEELAPEFKVYPTTILYLLETHNIARRKGKITPKQEVEIISRYKKGEPARSIAKELRLQNSSVCRMLRKKGVARRRKMLPTHELEALSLYKSGRSTPSIATKFKVSASTIERAVRRLKNAEAEGVKYLPPPPRRDKGQARKLSKIQIKMLCQEYLSEKDCSELSSTFGLHKTQIAAILKQNGIKIRTNKLLLNHSFFTSIDTEEKAYWLGFLAADGCVTDNNRLVVNLHMKDKEHLEKLKLALESEHSIGRTSSRPHMVSLQIMSGQLISGLAQWGVHPRKTFTLKWPNFLSESLICHYLRGYIDGDGCFRTWKGKKSLRTSVSMIATKDFCIGAQDFLMSSCQLSRTKLLPLQTTPNMFTLAYGGNLQVARIAHLLYDRATIFLGRKHEKIKHLL